ncbi:MAG: DNA-binding response regulator [Phenylobacterium zucineum]|nr:MAG: DNA-binding response regulator [Phenylobacterium zucineum]
MRLLVIEDDATLSDGLRRALHRAGYTVDLARDGEEGLAAASAQTYGAILLDLGLPQVSGMSVLRALRDRGDTTPVIILTANDKSGQKVAGLDGGADDYVSKPFDLDELLARIRAQIRGRDGRASDTLSVGDVRLDLAGRRVERAGAPAAVTAKEFRVLAELMRRPGRFVSKGELEDALYDGEEGVESNTIEVAVYGLRRKLGADLILTARGLGYMVGAAR